MGENITKTGIIYCRVSSSEQVDGTSLGMQKQACLEFCKKQGITIKHVFIEKGESAKTAQRTEFIKAIDFCKEHKGTIDHFIVWKIDRFARHTADHFKVKAMLSKYGVSIRSVTETISDDPQGHLMETILAGFAQLDNDIRSLRSRNGMEERMRQGIWVWKAPIGYYRKQKGANLSIDPETAPMIRYIFETYSSGPYTYEAIAQLLEKQGYKSSVGKPYTQQTIQKILVNPIYCGIIRAWGAEHKAAFEPIIEPDLFNRCQKGYKERIKSAPRTIKNPDFPLRRLVICDTCHMPLTGSASTGRHGKKYPYYHHQKQDCIKALFIPKKQLEEMFVSYLHDITPTLQYEEVFKEVVMDIWTNNHKVIADAQKRMRIERDKLEQERQRIFEAHQAGIYTNEEFLEQKKIIVRKLAKTEINQLQDTKEYENIDIEAALDHFFNFARNSAENWPQLDYSEKLRFQKLIFEGNIPFNGVQFGTAKLSTIYAMSREFTGDKSQLVTQTGTHWNRIYSLVQLLI